jgi:hypothetical protein
MCEAQTDLTKAMPRLLYGVLLVCAISVLGSLKSAGQVIASDNFDSYSIGSLANGSNGGSGWSGGWTVSGSNSSIVDMSVALPGQGYLSGDLGLSFTGNNNAPVVRNFSSQSGSVFVSYDFTLSSGSVENNDFVSMWFQTNQYPSGPNIGFKGDQATNTASNFDLFTRTQGGNEVYGGPSLVVGETYTLVGQLFKSSGTGNYDHFALWVDPAYADSGSPDATSTGDSGFSAVSSIGWRLVNLDTGDQALINNLKFGETWGDVVEVIPEPSTYALIMGVVVISIILFRGRSA